MTGGVDLGTGLGAYGRLLRHGPASRPFVFAALARLTLAMVPLGILILVEQERHAYAIAGVVSGGYALGAAVGTPVWGRLMDRFGQVAVLLPTVVRQRRTARRTGARHDGGSAGPGPHRHRRRGRAQLPGDQSGAALQLPDRPAGSGGPPGGLRPGRDLGGAGLRLRSVAAVGPAASRRADASPAGHRRAAGRRRARPTARRESPAGPAPAMQRRPPVTTRGRSAPGPRTALAATAWRPSSR